VKGKTIRRKRGERRRMASPGDQARTHREGREKEREKGEEYICQVLEWEEQEQEQEQEKQEKEKEKECYCLQGYEGHYCKKRLLVVLFLMQGKLVFLLLLYFLCFVFVEIVCVYFDEMVCVCFEMVCVCFESGGCCGEGIGGCENSFLKWCVEIVVDRRTT
jgi:hypothetical protein